MAKLVTVSFYVISLISSSSGECKSENNVSGAGMKLAFFVCQNNKFHTVNHRVS